MTLFSTPSDLDPLTKATERLHAFIRRMNAWEIDCALRERACEAGEMSYDDSSTQGEEAYLQIYREFFSMNDVSIRSYQFSEPPDYDPQNEAIVTCQRLAPDLIEVETTAIKAGPQSHVYRLVLRGERWLLSGKWFIGHGGERVPATL